MHRMLNAGTGQPILEQSDPLIQVPILLNLKWPFCWTVSGYQAKK